MSKLKYFLVKYDGIWSVPVAFFVYWFVGYLMQSVWNMDAGSFDLAFIQPLFLAIGVVIASVNAAMFGMRFNFKGPYKYFYGFKDSCGDVQNKSKTDWTSLTPFQRFKITLSIYFMLVFAVILVFVAMV